MRPLLLGSPLFAGPSQAVDFVPPSNHWLLVSQRSSKTPARPGNCFAWGKFGPWRFEFVQSDKLLRIKVSVTFPVISLQLIL